MYLPADSHCLHSGKGKRVWQGDMIVLVKVERFDKQQRRSMMEIRLAGTSIPLIPDMKTLPSTPNARDASASAVSAVVWSFFFLCFMGKKNHICHEVFAPVRGTGSNVLLPPPLSHHSPTTKTAVTLDCRGHTRTRAHTHREV